MGHIHTEPGQHDFTVSAFIVRTDFEEPRIMLHLHKKLGKWMQFGGHVELNENPWQAIAHELEEESGYDLSQLTLIEPFKGPELTNCERHPTPISVNTHAFDEAKTHFHTDLTYAFATNQKPNHEIRDGESENISYFSLHELNNIPDDQIPSNIREIGIFVLSKIHI